MSSFRKWFLSWDASLNDCADKDKEKAGGKTPQNIGGPISRGHHKVTFRWPCCTSTAQQFDMQCNPGSLADTWLHKTNWSKSKAGASASGWEDVQMRRFLSTFPKLQQKLHEACKACLYTSLHLKGQCTKKPRTGHTGSRKKPFASLTA